MSLNNFRYVDDSLCIQQRLARSFSNKSATLSCTGFVSSEGCKNERKNEEIMSKCGSISRAYLVSVTRVSKAHPLLAFQLHSPLLPPQCSCNARSPAPICQCSHFHPEYLKPPSAPAVSSEHFAWHPAAQVVGRNL